MENHAFVDSVIKEIVQPGVDALMQTRYFAELREGKLSKKRLQGFAVQHYLHNIALVKGLVLCMAKNAANGDLYEHFREQFNEEQYHPELAKKFGFALGLTEADFEEATPVFECFAHTSAPVRVPAGVPRNIPRITALVCARHSNTGVASSKSASVNPSAKPNFFASSG